MGSSSRAPRIWCGIVTAPRPAGACYLPATLASAQRAGLDPIVFTQHPPDEIGPVPADVPIVWTNTRPVGAWQNWLAAAERLGEFGAILGNRSRDWYLILEDDIELTEGLTRYLSDNPPPDRAVTSLYCAAPNDPEYDGLAHSRWTALRVPLRAYGALAYLIRFDTLATIVQNPPRPAAPHGTDHNVGLFCRDHKVPYLVQTPSLARHLGTVSSLPDAGTAEARQCRIWANRYIGPTNFGMFCFASVRQESGDQAQGSLVNPAGT